MFKVGDKVVCVDDITNLHVDHIHLYYSEWLMENKIYTIRAINEEPNWPGVFGVLLEEIKGHVDPRNYVEYGFSIKRFRKLEPPKEELREIEEVLEEVL